MVTVTKKYTDANVNRLQSFVFLLLLLNMWFLQPDEWPLISLSNFLEWILCIQGLKEVKQEQVDPSELTPQFEGFPIA